MRRTNGKDSLRSIIITFLLILVIPILALTCYQLQCKINTLENSIADLEQQFSTLQDQQLSISEDQLWMTDALANWLESWQMDMFKSSAYSPLDDRNGLNSWGDGQYMASGARTAESIDIGISVDPEIIPLGTTVYVKGLGWRIALDTGGSIKGKKIDIPMKTFDEAITYGLKDVVILYPKPKEVKH